MLSHIPASTVLESESDCIRVHFLNWRSRYDETVPLCSGRIQEFQKFSTINNGFIQFGEPEVPDCSYFKRRDKKTETVGMISTISVSLAKRKEERKEKRKEKRKAPSQSSSMTEISVAVPLALRPVKKERKRSLLKPSKVETTLESLGISTDVKISSEAVNILQNEKDVKKKKPSLAQIGDAQGSSNPFSVMPVVPASKLRAKPAAAKSREISDEVPVVFEFSKTKRKRAELKSAPRDITGKYIRATAPFQANKESFNAIYTDKIAYDDIFEDSRGAKEVSKRMKMEHDEPLVGDSESILGSLPSIQLPQHNMQSYDVDISADTVQVKTFTKGLVINDTFEDDMKALQSNYFVQQPNPLKQSNFVHVPLQHQSIETEPFNGDIYSASIQNVECESDLFAPVIRNEISVTLGNTGGMNTAFYPVAPGGSCKFHLQNLIFHHDQCLYPERNHNVQLNLDPTVFSYFVPSVHHTPASLPPAYGASTLILPNYQLVQPTTVGWSMQSALGPQNISMEKKN